MSFRELMRRLMTCKVIHPRRNTYVFVERESQQ